jgi:hypothetical protein
VSFSEGKGDWIWAFSSSGGAKDTTDQSAGISEHSNKAAFSWDYASAKGGSSANPLVNASPSGTASCVPRPASTGGSSGATGTSTGARTSSAAGTTPTSRSGDDDYRTRFGYPSQWGSIYPSGPWPTGPPGGNNESKFPKPKLRTRSLMSQQSERRSSTAMRAPTLAILAVLATPASQSLLLRDPRTTRWSLPMAQLPRSHLPSYSPLAPLLSVLHPLLDSSGSMLPSRALHICFTLLLSA